ncbi:hypothetical protein D9M69_707940 [compost metagenome]
MLFQALSTAQAGPVSTSRPMAAPPCGSVATLIVGVAHTMASAWSLNSSAVSTRLLSTICLTVSGVAALPA